PRDVRLEALIADPNGNPGAKPLFEWQVSRAFSCLLLSNAEFIVTEVSVDASDTPTTPITDLDRERLKSVFGIHFDNEARLRAALVRAQISFTPSEPVWYRALLQNSETTDSGKTNLYPRTVEVSAKGGGTSFHFAEPSISGANLESLDCQPTPADT